MIYDGKNGDIINQYLTFTKVLDEQMKLHGRSKKAVQETNRCSKKVAAKFVLSHETAEKEVGECWKE